MNLNQALIDQFNNGRIVIQYNHTASNLEILRQVTGRIFYRGCSRYYWTVKGVPKNTFSSPDIDIPTVHIEDFIVKEFVLPEKWYIRGCAELCKFLTNHKLNIHRHTGASGTTGYFIDDTVWEFGSIICFHDKKAITLDQYKQSLLNNIPMKLQQLTRAQLITAMNAFTCDTWVNNIKSILNIKPYALDDSLIDIDKQFIILLNANGTLAQKEYVTNLGIVLKEDRSVTVIKQQGNFIVNDALILSLNNDGKSFSLNGNYDWNIKRGDNGIVTLTPTKQLTVKDTTDSL